MTLRTQPRCPKCDKHWVPLRDETVKVCPSCRYGLRIGAKKRRKRKPRAAIASLLLLLSPSVQDYVAAVSQVLHVPEPIEATVWEAPGLKPDGIAPATIQWAQTRWLIRLYAPAWMDASERRRLEMVAHEMCHAVYDYAYLMGQEGAPSEKPAQECAKDVLRRLNER